MKDITKTRLKLIITKCQLLLANDNHWHDDASTDISEIVNEAKKALDEIASSSRWSGGNR